MKKIAILILLFIATIPFFSCENETTSEPMLIVKFQFDPNQVRLNNLGQPSAVLAGNAGQSPIFNTISAHYVEMAPNANTQLGQGEILYHAPETTLGGSNAIDFAQSKIAKVAGHRKKAPVANFLPKSSSPSL